MADKAKARGEDAPAEGSYTLFLAKHWQIPDTDVILPAGETTVPATLLAKIPAEIINGEPKRVAE